MKTTKIISPYFENGVFAGARVTLGDEDFVIAPKDYQGGEGMNWHSAMDALNADNLSTWSCRQVRLTMAYRKEVDKALKDIILKIVIGLVWKIRIAVHSSILVSVTQWILSINLILVLFAQLRI